MNKKILPLALAFILIFTACGNSEREDKSTANEGTKSEEKAIDKEEKKEEILVEKEDKVLAEDLLNKLKADTKEFSYEHTFKENQLNLTENVERTTVMAAKAIYDGANFSHIVNSESDYNYPDKDQGVKVELEQETYQIEEGEDKGSLAIVKITRDGQVVEHYKTQRHEGYENGFHNNLDFVKYGKDLQLDKSKSTDNILAFSHVYKDDEIQEFLDLLDYRPSYKLENVEGTLEVIAEFDKSNEKLIRVLMNEDIKRGDLVHNKEAIETSYEEENSQVDFAEYEELYRNKNDFEISYKRNTLFDSIKYNNIEKVTLPQDVEDIPTR